MQADRRLRAGGVARPSLLVGRGALLHAYRRGGGDLGADRRGRRLVPVRDEDRGRPPHGRGHAGPPLTGCRKNRSEEHTSELQSLMRISYAVFCLKKKNNVLSYLINIS